MCLSLGHICIMRLMSELLCHQRRNIGAWLLSAECRPVVSTLPTATEPTTV